MARKDLTSLQNYISAQQAAVLPPGMASQLSFTEDRTPEAIQMLGTSLLSSYKELGDTIISGIRGIGTFIGEKIDLLTKQITVMTVEPRSPAQHIAIDENGREQKSQRNLDDIESKREGNKTDPWKILKDIHKTLIEIKALGRGRTSLGQLLALGTIIVGLIAGFVVSKLHGLITGIPKIMGLITRAAKIVDGVFMGLPLLLPRLFKLLGGTATNLTSGLFTKISHFATSGFTRVFGKVGSSLADLFSPGGRIGKILATIGDVFKPLTKVMGRIGGGISKFGDGIVKVASWIAKLVPTLIRVSKAAIDALPILGRVLRLTFKFASKILAPLGWAVDFALGLWEAWKTYKDGGSIKDIIIGFLSGFINSFSFGLLKIENLKSWFTTIWDAAERVFKVIVDFYQPIIDFFKELVNIWGDEDLSFIDKIKATFTAWIDSLKGMLGNVVDAIAGAFKAVVRGLIEIIPKKLRWVINDDIKDWAGWAASEEDIQVGAIAAARDYANDQNLNSDEKDQFANYIAYEAPEETRIRLYQGLTDEETKKYRDMGMSKDEIQTQKESSIEYAKADSLKKYNEHKKLQSDTLDKYKTEYIEAYTQRLNTPAGKELPSLPTFPGSQPSLSSFLMEDPTAPKITRIEQLQMERSRASANPMNEMINGNTQSTILHGGNKVVNNNETSLSIGSPAAKDNNDRQKQWGFDND